MVWKFQRVHSILDGIRGDRSSDLESYKRKFSSA